MKQKTIALVLALAAAISISAQENRNIAPDALAPARASKATVEDELYLRIVILKSQLSQALAASAQESPKPIAPPELSLTVEQKQSLIISSKDIELWQLRAQQAAGEFEKAKEAFQKLIASLTPAGYQITDKLELIKVPSTAQDTTKALSAKPDGK